MSAESLNLKCKEAFEKWDADKMHFCSCVKCRLKIWQAAWEAGEPEIEAKEDAMMAISDSLGVLANE